MRIESGPPLKAPADTIGDLLAGAVRKYGGQVAFEWNEGGKVSRWTYHEVDAKVRDVAAGLAALGVKKGDRVAILADTRPEWGIADLAIQTAGAVTVTLFTTLAADQVAFLLKDSGSRVAFVDSPAQFEKIRKVAADVGGVATWIAIEAQPPAQDEIAKRTMPLAEVEARGRAANVDLAARAPGVDDDSTIIYTSGTTGIPKGVVLTHRNCVTAARMPTQAFDLESHGDRATLVFLPLAHSLTRAVFLNAIDLGTRIGFSSPRTLIADLQAMPPRLLASAPRIYERIHDQYVNTAAQSPGLRRKILERAREVAIAYGHAISDGGKPSPALAIQHAIFEPIVYKKLRQKLGFQKLEMALSGAAAIRPELLYFFRGVGIVIVEAWGLTETAAPGATNPIDRTRPGTVGRPFPGVEIALDADGEILVAGPNVFARYHERPDENKEAFVELEGRRWFRTGDIGRWDDAGYLKIVDRKKELEVLDTGKKIAPISVEETLKGASPYVAEACLIGTGRKFAGALVQPNFDRLVTWAREHGVGFDASKVVVKPDPTGTPMTYAVGDDLLSSPEVLKLFEGEIAKCNAKVADYERIRAFRLVPHAFTIDRDELTITLKKKRRVILANYDGLVQSMFK